MPRLADTSSDTLTWLSQSSTLSALRTAHQSLQPKRNSVRHKAQAASWPSVRLLIAAAAAAIEPAPDAVEHAEHATQHQKHACSSPGAAVTPAAAAGAGCRRPDGAHRIMALRCLQELLAAAGQQQQQQQLVPAAIRLLCPALYQQQPCSSRSSSRSSSSNSRSGALYNSNGTDAQHASVFFVQPGLEHSSSSSSSRRQAAMPAGPFFLPHAAAMPLGLGSSQPQLQQQRRAASSGASSSSVDVPHLVDVQDSLRLATLLRRFRSRGHLVAQLDPLRRTSAGPWLGPVGGTYTRSDQTLLRLVTGYPSSAPASQRCAFIGEQLGLQGPATPDRLFAVGELMPCGPDGAPAPALWRLHDAVEVMAATYCGTLALECKHLQQQDEIIWMQQQFEARQALTKSQKRQVLRWLLAATGFEQFLSRKFPASKRFGLEGCEALLPGLLALVEAGAAAGVRKVEVAVAHRGRLSLLVNLLGKPLGALCTEMEGKQSDFRVGDVKYHLGQSGTVRVGPERTPVHVSIAPNPSHLEAVNPVVLGMVRAEQTALHRSRAVDGIEAARQRVMPLQIHGDAAFAGLGVVLETLQLADLPGYTVGGSVHVIINNQVGFTTLPRHGRSSPHPSDVMKVIGAPILHANADDPEAVVAAMQLAAKWRARWAKDVVVDIVGYRRNGHNELDDPSVTLPLSYQLIQQHPPVLERYARQLQAEGVVSGAELARWRSSWAEAAEVQWAAAGAGRFKESAAQFLSSSWQGDALASVSRALAEGGAPSDPALQEPTGLPLATLQRVGRAICTPPSGFDLHPDVRALLDARREMVADADSRVDWAMAEALAVGTLLLHRDSSPGTAPHPFLDNAAAPLGWGLNRGHFDVRISGQDCERGTFGQRHAVLWDQQSAQRLVLLNSIKPGRQDVAEVWNSPLNEAAVLGFEYGYSLGARDRALVVWEAQFGDFANNAQVIIDQFIASGEEKWGQTSGLVLLLPHGYDGQGPDHSSARIERWLQMAKDDPDALPGYSQGHVRLINDTFEALGKESGGKVYKEQVLKLLGSLGSLSNGKANGGNGGKASSGSAAGAPGAPASRGDAELAELLWMEMGVAEGEPLTRATWQRFMLQWLRRNAERDANLCIVNATTPAQYFHLLRRQVNLPHKTPLVLFTPKYLLHHRPASSALRDLTVGNFFNRVIDDGKSSDNTRHLAVHRATGEPYLLPPAAIRRVVLCTGQLYYQLSKARRARRLRDVVLVRLEQISPFPHDLLLNVVRQYENAELIWAQEEPSNMGAWSYVRPRLLTALRHCSAGEGGGGGGESGGRGSGTDWAAKGVTYVGRAAAASPATASFSIHQKELADIIDAALGLGGGSGW